MTNAIAQKIEGIRLHPGDAAFGFQHAGAVDVAKDFGGAGADEGITGDLLAPLDAFEQTGVARVSRQAQVGPYGRQEVGRKGFVNRDEIAFAGQAAKRPKVRLDHRRKDFSSFCNAARTTRRMAVSGARSPIHSSHCATP